MTSPEGQPLSSSPRPTITYHHSPTLLPVPPPQIAHAAVGGAHYSTMYTSQHARRRSSSGSKPRRASQSARDVEESERQKIVDDLNELFCCRPSIDIFKRTWRHDAVFEDPWVKCEGYDEYAPQFFVMPKLFSGAKILSSRILLSTQSPNRLIYSKSQEYTLRFLGKKRIDSMVVVDLDEDDKIIRVEDKWGGEELPTQYGASHLRRVSAVVTPWLVKVPKWQSD
ncbi:hypothetical protein EDD16DRAFT_474824 [Pisolithus croceorrhizus]|nr:hypothetical protein EDD16DRAFT_474824 [Pisolithus croceorrhizus]KAI6167102.1 hypothetical protein EDD17DRAFT_1108971 [Pisolithus thermaeus]